MISAMDRGNMDTTLSTWKEQKRWCLRKLWPRQKNLLEKSIEAAHDNAKKQKIAKDQMKMERLKENAQKKLDMPKFLMESHVKALESLTQSNQNMEGNILFVSLLLVTHWLVTMDWRVLNQKNKLFYL